MKNFVFNIFLLASLVLITNNTALAQLPFSEAVATCETYSQEGSIEHSGETFDLLITLNKSKGGGCIYKEKIYQNKNYQMLTCEFNKNQLSYISNSMKKFSKEFEKQIAKNKIFEAKLTTNGEVFQKYLANPNYCKITHSKK